MGPNAIDTLLGRYGGIGTILLLDMSVCQWNTVLAHDAIIYATVYATAILFVHFSDKFVHIAQNITSDMLWNINKKPKNCLPNHATVDDLQWILKVILNAGDLSKSNQYLGIDSISVWCTRTKVTWRTVIVDCDSPAYSHVVFPVLTDWLSI